MTELRAKLHDHPVYGKVHVFDEVDAISRHVLSNQIWEDYLCDWLASYYKPDTDVLDIGANLGFNSLRMQQIKPISEGCVYHLFEPQHDVFTLLQCHQNIMWDN